MTVRVFLFTKFVTVRKSIGFGRASSWPTNSCRWISKSTDSVDAQKQPNEKENESKWFPDAQYAVLHHRVPMPNGRSHFCYYYLFSVRTSPAFDSNFSGPKVRRTSRATEYFSKTSQKKKIPPAVTRCYESNAFRLPSHQVSGPYVRRR